MTVPCAPGPGSPGLRPWRPALAARHSHGVPSEYRQPGRRRGVGAGSYEGRAVASPSPRATSLRVRPGRTHPGGRVGGGTPLWPGTRWPARPPGPQPHREASRRATTPGWCATEAASTATHVAGGARYVAGPVLHTQCGLRPAPGAAGLRVVRLLQQPYRRRTVWCGPCTGGGAAVCARAGTRTVPAGRARCSARHVPAPATPHTTTAPYVAAGGAGATVRGRRHATAWQPWCARATACW